MNFREYYDNRKDTTLNEGSVNFNSVDFGDFWGLLQTAADKDLMGAPTRGIGFEQLFSELLAYYGKETLDDISQFDGQSDEVDDDVKTALKNLSKTKVKIKF
jgi:hypothetical protein